MTDTDPEDDGGFEAPARPVISLAFGGDLAGLRMTVHRAGPDQIRLAGRAMQLSDGAEWTSEDHNIVLELFEGFAESLVDWNVRIKGQPIPANFQGMRRLDDDFVLSMIIGWLGTVAASASSSAAPGIVEEAAEEAKAVEDMEASLNMVPLY